MAKKIKYLVDFNGTIALNDSTTVVAEEYNPKMLKLYLELYYQGKVTIRTFVKDLTEGLGVSEADYQRTLNEKVLLDPFFKEFVEKKLDFTIVSSGMDRGIYYVLQNAGISIAPNQIIANHIYFVPQGIEVSTPFYSDSETGVGKHKIIRDFQNKGYEVVYIGDGYSDCEAAQLADKVYAKDNLALSRYCQKQDIPYTEFSSFEQLNEMID